MDFTGGADGGDPIGGVIADAAGNSTAGTIAGVAYDQGTIFELTPDGRKYAEKTLVTFNGRNGSTSDGALVMDGSGTLFGTTVWGGAYGYGTAFRVTMKGGVRERVIWSFGGNRKDGANPDAGMVLDASGALYGTTSVGGPFGGGIAFRLTPSGRTYTETVMRAFGGDSDGKVSRRAADAGKERRRLRNGWRRRRWLLARLRHRIQAHAVGHGLLRRQSLYF